MKRNFLYVIVMLLVFACNKNDNSYDTYQVRLGLYENTGEGSSDFQINLDNGKVVIPVEITGSFSRYADGERVVVYFTSLEDETEEDQSINSAVHYVEDVLTKDIIDLTAENSDSIGNDAIHVQEEDIWISKNFLNIYFTYYGYDQIHYLNMIKYPNDSLNSEGRLILEFRHNNNDDNYTYVSDGLVSFDMNSLQQDGVDSLPIVVKVIDYEGDSIFWKDTYHFNESIAFSKNVEIQNKSSLIR